jgi:DMSO/TMAO reductase YedYZ heme-binding membrane subunit
MKIPKYWRVFHGLIYVVLFFGIVHANLLGEDFANLGIKLTFDALFASSIAGLGYKRYKNYRVRMKYRRFSKGQTSG